MNEKLKNKKANVDFIFGLILCISIIVIFAKFFSGNYFFVFNNDIGSDTYNQYYPYYVNVVKNIKAGTFSIWNFYYGLGTSILTVNAWTFDPFGIITILLGLIFGEENIAYIIVFTQIIKIITIYYLSKKYFSLMLKNNIVINLCAYISAMNGYLFLWGQHYFFGTAYFYMIFILYAIEKFIQSKGYKGYILLPIVTALMLIYSYYIGYMILIMCVIYCLYRISNLEYYNLKQKILFGLKIILSIFIGILISSVIFVPSSYYVMTNSSRLDNANVSILNRMYDSFKISIHKVFFMNRAIRLMSNNLLFINASSGFENNLYELPQYFTTIYVYFFIIHSFFNSIKNAIKEKKWCKPIINFIICYFVIFNALTGFIFNAFVKPTYRYTFTIIPFLILFTGQVFEKNIIPKKINYYVLIASFAISILIWEYSFKICTNEVMKYSLSLIVFLLLGFLFLFFAMCYEKKYNLFIFLFLTTIVLSTINENYFITTHRNLYDSNTLNKEKIIYSKTRNALDWIKEQDDSFYRVDYTYTFHQRLTDSFFFLTSGNSWYNSIPNKYVINYYNNIYPNAKWVEKWAEDAYKTAKYTSSYDLIAASIDNTKYILSVHEMNLEGLKKIKEIDGIYIYRNTYTDNFGKWYNKTISEEEFNKLDNKEKAKILQNTLIANVDQLDDSKAELGNFVLNSQTDVSGSVINESDGYLMLAIPHEEGWTISVDGKKAETFVADYGFYGLKLNAGEHKIEARYNLPKYKIGIVLSVIGIVLLAIQSIIIKRYRKILQ